ncbi:CgeB family protein [Paenibacillus hexagrammi]|uniref:Glycosyltransferase n=1 Tax=Paenibacillus hexagrammi TaxID=2908839 RepID=A0ABY3SFV2_9BACL|nr:glycosyltransferase [Paenibacillus sp. YPD9-1]UJF32076.1 glycosyltransferase [Paenibacillus sp. YPD9-1]
MRRSRTDWDRGQQDGYERGWRHGYHLGRCKGIMSRIPEDRKRREIRVLYVSSGLWSYRPLDSGITEELEAVCAEVRVALPTDPVADIAKAYRPDLVLSLNSVELLKVHIIDEIRAMGILTAVWFTDDPYYSDVTVDIAKHYDYVFTLEMNSVPLYRQAGCRHVYYLPFGVNRSLFHPQPASPEHSVDVIFIGSAFRNRVAFFDEIAPELSSMNLLIAGYWWDRLQHYDVLQSKIRTGYWISPEESARYYSSAKIVINMHRAIDDETNRNSSGIQAESINPRTFEISACAPLQLTDVRANLSAMYRSGLDIATYDSPQELVRQIQYYLGHEEQRQEIAWRGLERTMREHTYRTRIQRMFEPIYDGHSE